MQFKQYPSYKNSGVEWLGDVPEHWGMNRLGVHFRNRKEKVSDKDFKPLSVTKHGIVPQLEHAAKSDNGDNRKLVRKGDYVINSRSDRKGSSGLADLDGSVSLINIVLTPFKTIHPKFSHYLLRSYLFQEEFYKYGHGIVADLWTTNYEDMRNIHLALPSVSEQTQISNFLEQETTRIDNLISKQEKLIELLEEQRKSIISHAVTKGLNPNAPMKDSGVEWLGEVPEHWDVAVVKRAFIVKLGKMLQPDQKDETDVIKKYLKASNLTWDGVKDIDNEMWFSKNDLKKLKLEIGDLLVAEGGDVGKSCIFDSNEEFYYQNSVNRVRGQKNNANEFLYYWLFTLKYSGYIDILCNKSTIAHFTAEKLNETILLLPDSVEQNEIIAYLERENGKINQLILKQQSLIEKLKEYRTSIISHAVTGKIDVREFGA